MTVVTFLKAEIPFIKKKSDKFSSRFDLFWKNRLLDKRKSGSKRFQKASTAKIDMHVENKL
jgi:hypothetical protein